MSGAPIGCYTEDVSRTCRICGDEKSLEAFVTNRSCRHGKEHTCKACRARQAKVWKHTNRDAVQGYRAAYSARGRDIIRTAKAKPCVVCGGRFPAAAMDLHHRDPTTKLFTVAYGRARSVAALETEIAKCDAICANCHRIHHHEGALQ